MGRRRSTSKDGGDKRKKAGAKEEARLPRIASTKKSRKGKGK
jgi:hypothetical protein